MEKNLLYQSKRKTDSEKYRILKRLVKCPYKKFCQLQTEIEKIDP